MEREGGERFGWHGYSLDMLPRFSQHNTVNGHRIDPVNSSQLALRDANRTPDSYNLFSGKFIILAFTACLTAFGAHIGDIIQMGAKEQVLRPDARRIVATMENKQPIWNRTIVEYPTGTRGDNFSIATAFADGAVTADVVFADPKPALFCLLDIAPKSSIKGIRKPSGQCRVLDETRTRSLHTATGDSSVTQVISTDYRGVSAIALANVMSVAEPHAVIGNDFKLSKALADQGDFRGHSIASFNVVFSSGRPATTGAHCDLLEHFSINPAT